MHFILFFILVLTTFVQSAPLAALDAATLLQNAQEAQQLNAQFQSANNTATGSCNNGDTICVKNAIATCVNGKFDTSNASRCPATQQCFALPSVSSKGTTITCTSEKSAQSLINAAGATGDVTGSGSGGSTNSINPISASSTSNGTIAAFTAVHAAASMDADCITTVTATPTPTAASKSSVVTVTVTLIPSSVTQTLSPDQASIALASLLAQGGPTATPTPDRSDDEPSLEPLTSTFPTSATNIPPSSSPTPSPAVAIANDAGNSTSSGSGYSGY